LIIRKIMEKYPNLRDYEQSQMNQNTRLLFVNE